MDNQRVVFGPTVPFNLAFSEDANGVLMNQMIDSNMDALVTVAWKQKTKATADTSSNAKMDIGYSATSGASDNKIADGVVMASNTFATNRVLVPAGEYLTAHLLATDGTTAMSSVGIVGWFYIESIAFPA